MGKSKLSRILGDFLHRKQGSSLNSSTIPVGFYYNASKDKIRVDSLTHRLSSPLVLFTCTFCFPPPLPPSQIRIVCLQGKFAFALVIGKPGLFAFFLGVQLLGFALIVFAIGRHTGVADFVDRNRKLFSGISAFFLSLVPWIQVSKSRSLLLMVKPKVFLVAIGLGALLHVTLLVFNSIAVRSLSVISGGEKSTFSHEENANALILVASQKTLPVMVAVIEPLCGAFGESGLLVLPCIATHLIQIIVDSFLVNFMRRKDNPNNVKLA